MKTTTHSANYDQNNIFARILRGEISSKTILEDEFFLAFYDVNPKAPIHVLVIPKGAYVNAFDFHEKAGAEEVIGFYKGINKVVGHLKLEAGFRLVSNTGKDGGQEVPHYHVHILAGGKIPPMA